MPFTDIVDSTERAWQLLDRRWRQLLDHHDELAARSVEEASGRLVKTSDDGILATFDGPGRGIGCAAALRDYASLLLGSAISSFLTAKNRGKLIGAVHVGIVPVVDGGLRA